MARTTRPLLARVFAPLLDLLVEHLGRHRLENGQGLHGPGRLLAHSAGERESNPLESGRAGQAIETQLVRLTEKIQPCTILDC